MSRIDPALAAAFASGARLGAFVTFEFDSGTVRLWTGVREFTRNGAVFSPGFGVLRIDFPSETSEVRAAGGTIELSGIDPSAIAIADTEPYQGRRVTIELGAIGADGTLIDVDITFRGIVDVIEPEDLGTTCKLAVKIEGRFADLGRARERRWTDEEQKLDWPNDRFFEFQAALADREVQWGPDAAAPPQPPKKGFFERLFG